MDERQTHGAARWRRALALAVVGAGLLASGCGKDGVPTVAGGLRVEVAPLQLNGIEDAVYELAVFNAANDLVWERTGLSSQQFGDGQGGISYVGTCDASAGANPNRVELTLVSLSDMNGPLTDGWQNPTADGPLVLEVDCVENRDVAVTFNVTVLRDADQGFFDVAVEFEDVFCSAKLDCVDSQDQDLHLLFDPATEERGTTVVMGFACVTGQGTPTWLHLDNVHVACDVDQSYWFNPSLDAGNIPGQAPTFFGAAVYRGSEQLPGYDKCYWNMAFGINEGSAAQNCVLTGEGTATEQELVDRRTPPGVYPYVKWRVQLTDAAGQVTCGRQPLNGVGSQVTTEYTPITGEQFTHSMACGTHEIVSQPQVLCGGQIVGVNSDVSVKWTAGGVSVTVGDNESPPYGVAANGIGGCCLNPCCTTGSN